MATIQAVFNRRMNRRARKEAEARRAEARNRQEIGVKVTGDTTLAWAIRQRKDREAAARLCAKHFRDPLDPALLQIPTPIVLLYDYWQARSCGWDVLTAQYSRDELDAPCSPQDSRTWLWWEDLHYKQRRHIHGGLRDHRSGRH